MSKINLALVMIAAALLVAAVYFEVSWTTGGTGVLLLVAVGYAYVVAKREATLLIAAIKDRDENRFRDTRAPREPAE